MRFMKGLIAGACALLGLACVQTEAEARPMVAPHLVQVSVPVDAVTTEAAAAPCYYYGWHRPFYGYHRRWHPYGYGYGFRPRFYGWHPHYRYGWHRRFY